MFTKGGTDNRAPRDFKQYFDSPSVKVRKRKKYPSRAVSEAKAHAQPYNDQKNSPGLAETR